MKYIKLLSALAFLFCSVVVVLGAFTRLVDAGLGCPDWPTCYGHLWVPSTTEEILTANQNFNETPVETDKTWPEQIHRILASNLGLIIVLIFIGVLLLAKNASQKIPLSVPLLLTALVVGTVLRVFLGDQLDVFLLVLVFVYFGNLIVLTLKGASISLGVPFKLSALLVGLVIVQGLFGMWTVTLDLWPQVVTAHLLGGFFTLSMIWLLLQRVVGFSWRADPVNSASLVALKPYVIIALTLVVLQVALGGWTSSNYAALACPDFPLCQNQVWPRADFGAGFNIMQTIGPNYLGGVMSSDARISIHLCHRIGALLVSIFVSILMFKLWRAGTAKARRFTLLLGMILLVQLTLGVTNIVLSLPLYVAVSHTAGGAILLLTIVTLCHRLYTLETHTNVMES